MGWIALHTEVGKHSPHLTLAWWPKNGAVAQKRDREALILGRIMSREYIRPLRLMCRNSRGLVMYGSKASPKTAILIESRPELEMMRRRVQHLAKGQYSWNPHVTWESGRMVPHYFDFMAIGVHTSAGPQYFPFRERHIHAGNTADAGMPS
jgi:hypothetical protein